MDHAEATELLELAAVEPGGLDRLTAGDTPQAAALAGHMAACELCPGLISRLRRDAPVIRQIVRTTPPPDLRDRTLAYVAEVGRPRGAGSGAAPGPSDVAPLPAAPWPATPASEKTRGGRGRWIAAIAAALIIVVAGAGLVLNLQTRSDLDRQAAEISGLSRIATRSLEIGAEADASRVALAGSGDLDGTILFSGAAMELVIVADGLEPPEAGKEFRCWVEIDGQRVLIGKMFFGGGLSYWAGDVDVDLAAARRFGVTLVESAGTSVDGEPVLVGER